MGVPPDALTVLEAVDFLGVSEQWLRIKVAQGEVPCRRLVDGLYFSAPDLAEGRRCWLIEHLTAYDKHRVLSYGPSKQPEALTNQELEDWHRADHALVEGVGPRDGHAHD